MRHWLIKSEPDVFGVDDLARAPKRTTAWEGVRNYQARNMLRDDVRKDDQAFFYHSSCEVPGIAGIIEVARAAYPDETQFDRKTKYYDAAATKDAPRWFNVDVRALKKTRLVSLEEMRRQKPLAKMVTLRPGNRLSITPVTEAEWQHILKLL